GAFAIPPPSLQLPSSHPSPFLLAFPFSSNPKRPVVLPLTPNSSFDSLATILLRPVPFPVAFFSPLSPSELCGGDGSSGVWGGCGFSWWMRRVDDGFGVAAILMFLVMVLENGLLV
ncbi:hypothetical protein Drorol1_Dr00008392, partial [Drosera rotundifolia]